MDVIWMHQGIPAGPATPSLLPNLAEISRGGASQGGSALARARTTPRPYESKQRSPLKEVGIGKRRPRGYVTFKGLECVTRSGRSALELEGFAVIG
jgi:hypothetical protein